MKTLSKKQRTFLDIVDRVNHQVEVLMPVQKCYHWYDKEISPFDMVITTHQSILMAEGMSMFHFNREIVKNKLKIKKVVPGEGFSDISPRNTVLIITSQMI